MKIITRIMFLVLFLWLLIRVLTQFGGSRHGCSPGNVTVDQLQTGQKPRNKQVWKVTVANECPCTFEQVRLYCAGFKSVKRINSSIISRSDNLCLVNNGLPIHPYTYITFTYVSTHQISLVPY
ncbi:hypothetical protein ACP275_05G145900 [Erythranthe tilingii]